MRRHTLSTSPSGTKAIDAHHAFRPDVQGLRALSILAVVFYHAQVPGFSGGFVGVDIFFVISGYLICSMLFRELAHTGRVNLLHFWAGRARRLLPNACLTLAIVLIAGAALMPAHSQSLFSREVAYAALYVSNYHFAAKAVDYFRSEEPASPVLHFWSLSVEEQFYIVWPLVLLILGLTFRRNLLAKVGVVLALIWVGSFVLSLAVVWENQSRAFFHTETRSWQLATGGLLAFLYPAIARAPPRMLTAAAWFGLAGILLSIVGLNDAVSYPGIWALAPSLGCAAVIAGASVRSGLPSPRGLLSLAPMQWIGDRSYSWYLWHWPILIFAPAFFDSLVLAILLSLAVAALAYALVEYPIHKGKLQPASPTISLAGSGAAVAAVLLAGLVAAPLFANNAPAAAITRQLEAAALDHGRVSIDNCALSYEETEQPACAYGATHSNRKAVLFGDSHAAQWFTPLDEAARETGWELSSWTKMGCPSVDVSMWSSAHGAIYKACEVWREAIMRKLTGPERPHIVFLSNNTGYGGKIRDPVTGNVLYGKEKDIVWRRGFETILRRLTEAGIKVVVIRDIPRAYPDYAACLANAGGAMCNRPRAQALTRTAVDIESAQSNDKIEILDFTDYICDAVVCPVIKDGIIVYWNYHHLTATFAKTLAPQFRQFLSGSMPGIVSAD